MLLSAVQRRTINAILQIFETGRYTASSYGAVANIKGDAGGLSYGQHQASITSGNLYLLLQRYADAKGAYAKDIAGYLPRIKTKDRGLGGDAALRGLLVKAGSDPIMQMVQDDFFYHQFMEPAVDAGEAFGFTLPTSYAVIYDSFIHGSWGAMRDRTLQTHRVADEKDWITGYLQTRRGWLISKGKPLSGTVYRPDTFLAMIKAGNWNLNLPIVCHGVTLTTAMLAVGTAPASDIPAAAMVKAPETPVLLPVKPSPETPLGTGKNPISDTAAVQTALLKLGLYQGKIDGLFGPLMTKAVKAFQRANGLQPDGAVGNRTLNKLGLL